MMAGVDTRGSCNPECPPASLREALRARQRPLGGWTTPGLKGPRLQVTHSTTHSLSLRPLRPLREAFVFRGPQFPVAPPLVAT
jgi:hypothetical protein